MVRILFGVILGLVLAPLMVMAWFHFGHPPVAVADKPLPFERQIVHVPMNARIDREMPSSVPVDANAETFLAGAQVYRDNCSGCHGFYGKPSSLAKMVFPAIPQLWVKHHNGNVVGVSDDPPGETYWKVENGIRLSAMPAYKGVLSETQIWQVAVLLANADKPLPPDVLSIVKGEQPTPATQTSSTPAK